MPLQLLKRVGATALAALTVACATPSSDRRPTEAPPPAANAEPIPPVSQKKAVILPSDVKLGSAPATTGSPGTPAPTVGAATATPTAPN